MKVLKVLVDADACPVKNIILQEARQRSIPVVMVMDTAHQYEDGYSQVVTVDKGADSADFQIVALAEPGDIVVTRTMDWQRWRWPGEPKPCGRTDFSTGRKWMPCFLSGI